KIWISKRSSAHQDHGSRRTRPTGSSLDLIKEAMLKEVAKGSKGFLIDGYPREVKQGEQFEHEASSLFPRYSFRATFTSRFTFLFRSKKRKQSSSSSGRADDNMETIKKRLKTFTTATAPVVDYYEKKNKLVRVIITL
ncbi:adenylate kinase isoenzyme 5 domain protein, partial [Oesophagostomum dentatum]